MIKSTKDYSIFKFRADNREEISESHVNRIVASIKSMNMLKYKPILVNKHMEIIDGQTRLRAAEQLGLEIYYQISEKFNDYDIILMNTQKQWTLHDYLNFYCQNHYEEYIKFRDFMKYHQLSLSTALRLITNGTKTVTENFRLGQFIFAKDDTIEEALWVCKTTIDYIKRIQSGPKLWLNSSKFWCALLKFVRHGNFDLKHWMVNLEKMIDRVGPRVNTQDYFNMLIDIFNWRYINKIGEYE